MLPLTYIHALRTADGVGGWVGRGSNPHLAVNGLESTDGTARAEASVLAFCRDRGRPTANENGAMCAEGQKARFCPVEGQGRAFCVLVFIRD